MIAVESLKKHYDEAKTRALAGVTFSIEQGEFVAIMGPSGSGKSTLLHILGFLDRPTTGSYRFYGKSIDDLADDGLARIRNADMGFVFQAFNLLSRQTVFENVELPLLYGTAVARRVRADRVRAAVEAVGLQDKLFSEAGKLSGGEKQRVAIARALVNRPRVIFADEPTGNLDSQSGAKVMEILRALNARGHTVVLVTHETYTAEFAERLIKIKDGRIASDEKVANRRKIGKDFLNTLHSEMHVEIFP